MPSGWSALRDGEHAALTVFDVTVCRFECGERIASAQGGDDVAVLGIRYGEATALHQSTGPEQVQFLDQLAIGGDQPLIAAEFDDEIVQPQIERVVVVKRLGRCVHAVEQRFQLAQLRLGDDAGQQARREPEKSGAHVVEFLGFVPLDAPDEHPAVGNQLDEPEFRQGSARLAHRATADPEPGGQCILVDALSGGEAAIQDQALDFRLEQGGERLRFEDFQFGGHDRIVLVRLSIVNNLQFREDLTLTLSRHAEMRDNHCVVIQPVCSTGCSPGAYGEGYMNTGILLPGLALLALAVIAVPFAKRAGLGGPIGYVLAGLIAGPSGFKLFTDPDNIRHVSELGVAMLLFLIGLELKPARLRVMRRSVFGLGSAQVAISAALVWGAAKIVGLPDHIALLLGLGAAMSSTALALPMLAERQLIGTPAGRDALGILLFQDLAIIPILAALPLFAPDLSGPSLADEWPEKLALAAGAIAVIVLGGRYLVRPLFFIVDIAKSRELFSAVTLLIVIGVAALASFAGLSMSLGAFLAGVILSNSEYRHEIQADLEPFEGLLLGLFFASIGMSIDVAAFWQQPGQILLIVAGALVAKGAVVFGLARIYGHDATNALRLAIALAQVGEFALVLFTTAGGLGLMTPEDNKTLFLVIVLSMVAAPLLFAVVERWVVPILEAEPVPEYDEIEETASIIVCGFGRFGQVIGRILRMRDIPFTAMDDNAAQVEVLRRFGAKVYYGDPARYDLLRAAGAEQARFLVVTVADIDKSLKIVDVARRNFPHLRIYARARNRRHAHQLMDYEVDVIVREVLHSSLQMTEELLEALGMDEHDVRRTIEIFREYDEKMLQDQHAFYDDEGQLIQTAIQAAAELETLFQTDREAQRRSSEDHDAGQRKGGG